MLKYIWALNNALLINKWEIEPNGTKLEFTANALKLEPSTQKTYILQREV